MHICWNISGISLYDFNFKKLLILLILVLYAPPQFSLSLKQAILAPEVYFHISDQQFSRTNICNRH